MLYIRIVVPFILMLGTLGTLGGCATEIPEEADDEGSAVTAPRPRTIPPGCDIVNNPGSCECNPQNICHCAWIDNCDGTVTKNCSLNPIRITRCPPPRRR